MDPFPSPTGCWVKQCHHHSTLITLNTNLLQRQMDPTGKRRKREYFVRLTCTERSGKGRGSQDTHTHRAVSKILVLITCEIHDINLGTWLQLLLLPRSFECAVSQLGQGAENCHCLLSPPPKKDKAKRFSPA